MPDYNINDLFKQLEDDLIASMMRNLSGHELEEKDEGFKWEQWQSKKLRKIVKYQKCNKNIVNRVKKGIGPIVKQIIRTQYLEGGRRVDTDVTSAIEKGLKLVTKSPSDAFFAGDDKKLNSLIKAVNNDLNNASHAALRKMDDAYRSTVFKAEMFAGSGTKTVAQAVDMATKDFLSKGIDCITYSNGAQVNINSYANMAIRTANKRAQLMGEGERRKDWGESLVLVSQYSRCSPLCKPWQGRVYIDDVYSGGKAADGPYPLLSTAIAGHLFHPNCRHTMSTYFEGITEKPKLMTPDNTEYDIASKSAEAKRNARKYERLKNGSVDPDNIKKYSEKQKLWNTIYKSSRYKNDEGCFTTFDGRGKGFDVIKPKKIMNEMNKSDIGKELLKYANENQISISMLYGIDNPSNRYGVYDSFDNSVLIYADITKTVHETSLTVIHELTHAKIQGIGGRKEEVLCFINEAMHEKRKLTYADIKNILKSVNSNDEYKKLKWKNG